MIRWPLHPFLRRLWIVGVIAMLLVAILAVRAEILSYQPQTAQEQMSENDAVHNANTVARMGDRP